MSAELRQDLVTGNFVLVNPARSGRPFTVARRADSASADWPREGCPFCSGNEHDTAEELFRIPPGAPATPGWRVRVVRNRYPVVGGTDRATGRCEVVVYRSHERRLEDMNADEVTEILTVIRDRIAGPALAGARALQVFVNVEAEGGASIAHPHAQIIGLDFVPPALDLEFAMIADTADDPVRRDLALARERDLLLVDDGSEIAAWCPWGSTSPFGVRLAPPAHRSDFVDSDVETIAALGRTLRDVLRALSDLLRRPAYNVVLFRDETRDGRVRRWRIDVVPRINVGGGFEIGAGVTTHSTATPAAAQALRSRISPAVVARSNPRRTGETPGPSDQ